MIPRVGIEMLEKQGLALTLWDRDRPMTQDELWARAKDHDILLSTLTEKISKPFLKACPRIKMVSQFAVGYDNIDIPAATALGIPVGYAPGVMTEATADIAFGLMIATARKMFFLHKTILAGGWDFFRPTGHLGMELTGKTLGIMGMGRIGMAMARRCCGAYGMKVIYHSRQPNPEADRALSASWVSFEDLLAQSDVVSVHTVLNDETRGIFNSKAFGRMKPSALFINTGRGPLHNEEDLRKALEDGIIGGAGLDVTDPEPMAKDNPLLEMENVCILPHIGSATQEARDGMSVLAAQNIISYLKTGRPGHLVNPEALQDGPPVLG
jgi:glyoxylate reductase